jgi:beta-lactamase regulating signal transducer with metallopeptidase domain
MTRESLVLAAVQSGLLFLAIWIVFRLVPSISANAKAWIWRLAFLKPVASLLPFAVITLHVLPAPPPAPVITERPMADLVPVANSAVPVSASPPSVPASDPALLLWLVGVACVAAYGVWNWAQAKRVVRRAQPVISEAIREAFDELRLRAGIKPSIRLLASAEVPSAMLVGGLRPAIVLPAKAVSMDSLDDVRLMLAHEIAHLARRDLAWFGLIWAVQSLFFFSPLVWVAARCSRLDHESATDRHASQLAEVPIQTYAEMLLRATVMTRPPLVPGTAPMAESYRTIHQRLEAMKHFNSQPSLWRKSAVATLALATVGLLPVYQLAQAAPVPQPQKPADVKAPQRAKAQSKVTAVSKRIRLVRKVKGKPDKVYLVQRDKDGWILIDGKARIRVRRPGNRKPSPAVKVRKTVAPKAKPKAPAPVSVPEAVSTGTVLVANENGRHLPMRIYATDKKTRVLRSESDPVQGPSPISRSYLSTTDPVTGVKTGSFRMDTWKAPGGGTEQTFTLTMEKCDVREALRAIFRLSNKSYELDPSLQGSVTFSFENVNLDAVLSNIVRAVDGRWGLRDEVYVATRVSPSE